MNYSEWNDLIARHFFNAEKAGREVLLYVTDELLKQLGTPQGVGADDFVNSIKAETASRDLCTFALKVGQNWRANGAAFPPYIGLLGLFVLSDVTEGDFVGHAYYPRLWARLGEEWMQGEPNQFDRMIEIWDDLEKWSREDKGEELGRFVRRIRGLRWKVGLARSQTLLSESERAGLPAIFMEAGLEPGDPPNSDALLVAIRHCKQAALIDGLYSRTVNLLIAKAAPLELRDALLAVLGEELEEWDGTLAGETEGPRSKQSLRIVIEETGGPFEGPLRARLRIWSRLPYPEDALSFAGTGRRCTCQEEVNGWSTPLECTDGQSPRFLAPDLRMWQGRGKLLDEHLRWGARQSDREVRIFYRQRFEIPLPGWIEAQRLETSREILIAAGPTYASRVAAWGPAACQNFRMVDTSGLPAGWKLFRAERVLASYPEIPLLTLPRQLSIKLKGGIKPGRGNTYLAFAPPWVWIELGPGLHDLQVLLEGKRLQPIFGQSGAFSLTGGLAPDRAYKVEAKTETETATLFFRLVAPEIADLEHSCPGRNADGTMAGIQGDAPVRGGQANAESAVECPRGEWPTILAGLPGSTLVGRKPSEFWQIGDPSAPNWQPIWAILARTHGRYEAVFCPDTLEDGLEPDLQGADHRASAAWKSCLWNNRKVTDPPLHSGAKRLWAKYVKAAADV